MALTQGHRTMTADRRLRDSLLAARPVIAATFLDPWWIIGSAAMALSGVPGVVPQDIDVLCSRRDAEALKARWKPHVDDAFSPQDAGRFRSLFARFTQLPMPLEAMGALQVMSASGWQAVEVATTASADVDGMAIPLPSLDEQRRILHLFGRDKDLAKAALLVDFMKSPRHVA